MSYLLLDSVFGKLLSSPVFESNHGDYFYTIYLFRVRCFLLSYQFKLTNFAVYPADESNIFEFNKTRMLIK
jgi:hypothetical protein